MLFSKKYTLEKYQDKKQDKISVSKFSIEMDWFILMIILSLGLIFVFWFSFMNIRRIETYQSESIGEDVFLIEEALINKKITDNIKDISGDIQSVQIVE